MLNMFTNFFEIWKHECIATSLLNMVTMSSTSEPRMYRTYGAQHGYEPIGSEHRASEIFDFVSMLKTQSV